MKSSEINNSLSKLKIKKLINIDADILSKIAGHHKKTFPEGFIFCLGNNFIEDYYKSLMTLKSYMFYVATIEDKIIGFLGYVLDQSDLDHLPIFRTAKKLAIMKICHLKINPVILIRFLIKKWLGRKVCHLPELMMIAVEPESRRFGIGSKLMSIMEEDLRKRNIKEYCVYTDNPEGLQFYKKLGLETVFCFSLFGKKSACFIKHL